MADVKLYGMPPSSFTRTARLVCHEKGVTYDLVPTFPGEPAVAAGHPFGRIPVLRHGERVIFETPAIARYLDLAFEGPALFPAESKAAVLCDTFMSIVGDYIYDDLVRGVLLPRLGFGQAEESRIAASIEKVGRHFELFDRHLAENEFLAGDRMSVADLFLVPPFFHVPKVPELHEIVARQTNLIRWAKTMGRRASIKATDPDLAAQGEKAA